MLSDFIGLVVAAALHSHGILKKDHSIVLNELVKEPATSSSKLILHSCRVHISQSDKVARYQRLLSVLQTHFAYEDYERTRLSA